MISLSEPYNKAVYQRNNSNMAGIPIVGRTDAGTKTVTATFTVQKVGAIQTLEYALPITKEIPVNADGSFSTRVSVPGGWYSLSVGNGSITANVNRVGAGEVFIIWGHSFMQWSIGAPSTDERVITLSDPLNTVNYQFEQLTGRVMPWHTDGPGAWGALGDKLVAKLGVPVMFYGCAYGGSNVDMNYKVLNNIPFEHGFIRYADRQPYRPMESVLTSYVPKTGVRGVLAEHGYNDSALSPEQFLLELNYVVDYTRNHFNHPNLPFMFVQEETSIIPGQFASAIPIGQALKTFIATKPNVWQGPDFNRGYWGTPGFHDNSAHMSLTGIAQFANDWNESLTTAFFANSQPVSYAEATTGTGTGTDGAVIQKPPYVQGENVNYIIYGLAALFLLGLLSERYRTKSYVGLAGLIGIYFYRVNKAKNLG